LERSHWALQLGFQHIKRLLKRLLLRGYTLLPRGYTLLPRGYTLLPRGYTLCSLFLLLAISALTGCSLDMLSGTDGFDQKIQQEDGYRAPNEKCSSLDLSNPEIDVPTFRKLTDCFNSQGALDPVARLVRSLEDSELDPIVRLLNASLLNNSRRIYDLNASFDRLSRLRLLDSVLDEAGRLLENTAFIESGIQLLDRAYRAKQDDLFLTVLARLSDRFDPEFVEDFLDLGMNLARTSSFQEILARIREAPESARPLRAELIEPLLSLLREQHAGGRGRLLQTPVGPALRSIENGIFYQVIDARLGSSPDEIRSRLPRYASAFGTLGLKAVRGDGRRTDAAALDDLSSLFHATQGEIQCFRGTQRVAQANLFIVRELLRRQGSELQAGQESVQAFLRRTIPLTLTSIHPFCDVPTELGTYYPTLSRLADTSAIVPITELLAEFDRVGLAPMVVNLLAATGTGDADNRGGLKHLLPLLSELTDRRMWDDLLYLTTSLPETRRRSLSKMVGFLLEPLNPQGAVDGPTILDGVLELASRVRGEDLEALLISVKPWIESPDSILEPVASKLRLAFFANDVHPVIELVQALLEESVRVPDLTATLLGIAKRPEFGESVKLVGRMSRDGSLKELIASLLTLFEKFGVLSAHPIEDREAPTFVTKLRHNWSSKLVPVVEPVRWDITRSSSLHSSATFSDPCLELTFKHRVDDLASSQARREFELFARCVSTTESHRETAEILLWLRTMQVNGRTPSLFDIQVELVRKLGFALSDAQLQFLTQNVIRSIDDRRLHRALYALPYLTETQLSGGRDDESSGTLAVTFVDLVRSLILRAQAGVRTLLDVGAELLRDESFEAAGRHLVKTYRLSSLCDPESEHYDPESCDLEPHPNPSVLRTPLSPEQTANLRDWIQNWECTSDSARIDARVRGAWKEYQGAMNSFELVNQEDPATGEVLRDSRGRVRKIPRMEWSRSDFNEAVLPLVKKYQNVSSSVPNRTSLQATNNLLRYFNLQRGQAPNRTTHFDRDGLFRWLRERADDVRPIAYIYEGESRPRVRLVSTIERFELLLWNANVQYLLPQNMGYQFLQLIGEAWGDEPSSIWPEEVLAQYPQFEACDRALLSENETARRRLVKRGACPRSLQDVWERDEVFPTFALTKSMRSTMRTFEFAVGFPVLPECPQKREVQDPGALISEEWRARSSGVGLMDEHVRVRLFNIRQLLSVVPENLPGAPRASHGPELAGGLKVLRNLFFELLYSSPPSCRDARAFDCNNLSIVPQVIRTGMLRKVVQKLREFPAFTENPAAISQPELQREYLKLRDFFRAIGTFTAQPRAAELLQALIGRDPQQEPLLFNVVVDRIFDMQEAADSRYQVRGARRLSVGRTQELAGLDPDSLSDIRAEWVLEERRMRKLVFDFAALAHRLQVIPALIPLVHDIASQHASDLSDQKRLILKLLRSRGVAHWVAQLVDDDPIMTQNLGGLIGRHLQLDRSPQLPFALIEVLRAVAGEDAPGSATRPGEGRPGGAELLFLRAAELAKLPAFQSLRLGELLEEWVDAFIAQPEGESPEWLELSRSLRLYLADRMESRQSTGLLSFGSPARPGDIENVLTVMALQPARFNELLLLVGRSARPEGDLQGFIELARRSLDELSPLPTVNLPTRFR
jgi:hypothetical protein